MAGPRRLAVPRRVAVTAGDDGRPLQVDQREVDAVRESWLIEDRWWTEKPLRRRYWEVVTTCGRDEVVFHDLISWEVVAPALTLAASGRGLTAGDDLAGPPVRLRSSPAVSHAQPLARSATKLQLDWGHGPGHRTCRPRTGGDRHVERRSVHALRGGRRRRALRRAGGARRADRHGDHRRRLRNRRGRPDARPRDRRPSTRVDVRRRRRRARLLRGRAQRAQGLPALHRPGAARARRVRRLPEDGRRTQPGALRRGSL